MSSLTLEIIEEFLRSSDTQWRKNALTALGTVGSDESLARLVRVAFDDTDPLVRGRAEQELARLDASAGAKAAAHLAAGLDRPDTEAGAYAILARLAKQGWEGVRPSGPLPQRVRRAIHRVYGSPVSLKDRLRLLMACGAGVFAFSLVVFSSLIFATGMVSPLEEVLVAIFLAGVLSLGFTLVALLRSQALARHFDTRAGVVVELLHAGVVAVGMAVLVLAIAVLGFGSSAQSEVAWGWVWIAMASVATALMTRLGTLVVAGHFAAPWNRLAMAVAGTVFGSATAVAGVVWAGALGEYAVSVAPNQSVFPLVLGSAGLALAGAQLDAERPVHPPFSRGVRRVALAAATAVAVGAFGWMSMPRFTAAGTAGGGEIALQAIGDNSPGIQNANVSKNPQRITFALTSPQQIDIAVTDPETRDLEMALYKASTNMRITGADDPNPPKLRVALSEGSYLLEVGRYGTLTYDATIFSVKLPLELALPVLVGRKGLVADASRIPTQQISPYQVSVGRVARP
jgi:hypothetical protein